MLNKKRLLEMIESLPDDVEVELTECGGSRERQDGFYFGSTYLESFLVSKTVSFQIRSRPEVIYSIEGSATEPDWLGPNL